jgi:hypothetical protein
MFEQTFVQSQARIRRPWTVAVSLSVQCLVVTLIVVIPLLHPEALRIPNPPPPHLIRTWINSTSAAAPKGDFARDSPFSTARDFCDPGNSQCNAGD